MGGGGEGGHPEPPHPFILQTCVIIAFGLKVVGGHSVKSWQGIPTTRLTLGGEVMVPRDNRTLVFSSELLNYIIPFATQGKIGHYNI